MKRNRNSGQLPKGAMFLLRYILAILAAVACLVLKLQISPISFQTDTPFMLFFAAIMVSAWFGGFGPGLTTTLLAALFCDYFFLPPLGTLGNTETDYPIRLALFLGEGLLISGLAGGLRKSWRRSEQSSTQAQQALSLRDNFLSIASHELKTPLTLLLGNAQLLQRRLRRAGDLDPRDERALSTIVDQAMRMNLMIDALLDLSRLHNGKLQLSRVPLTLQKLAGQLADEIRPTLVLHTLTVVAQDEPIVVDGDPLRLSQVLQNLIQNAIKYSPAGGPIELRVERREGQAATILLPTLERSQAAEPASTPAPGYDHGYVDPHQAMERAIE